jgi:hypothetical protein
MLALLGACTSTRPADDATAAAATAGADSTGKPATTQERALERYSSYAGPPVQSFTWLGHFDSWEPLGQDHLLVYTRANEAYLLKVSGGCDLRSGINTVGITSSNSAVYAGLDSIVVKNSLQGSWQCRIDEIRPVDVHRMKSAMPQR